jgi:hypothetical protein
LVVPSATALMMSFQVVLGSSFLSILGIRRASHPGTEAVEELTVHDAMRAKGGTAEPAPAEDAATEENETESAGAKADN